MTRSKGTQAHSDNSAVNASITPSPITSAGESLIPEISPSRQPAWNNPNGLTPAGPQGHESLALERAKASFDVNELTLLLHGKESLEQTARVLEVCENDPVFNKDNFFFESRTERFKGSMERGKHIMDICRERGWDDKMIWKFFTIVDEPGPLFLHFSMFKPTLHGQCDDAQKEKWLPLADNLNIVGCYSQTELGHGSNVQGLETTATYIPSTQEFEIHSPSLTASKWWAGGLGRTATHAIVVARLILGEKDHGTHTFIVQLRSLDDHTPLPGITIGDIGPKYGYGSVDNGFMLFDKVRIPRENMLMRFARVEPDGTYVRPPSSKLSYGTMVMVRANIVDNAATNLARATTIATRYSAVRRQFTNPEASKNDALVAQQQQPVETSVLDYPMQQHRLLTRIAQSYALRFTGNAMMVLYNNLMADLAVGKISALPEVHATSSGLKSLTTDMASAAMEDLRRSCGGHGFLKNSGFPEFIADYLPNVTYEGDNYLLTQQTVRYLIKTFGALKKASAHKIDPKTLTQTTRYLLPATSPTFLTEKWPVVAAADLTNETIVKAFAHRAATMVATLAADLATGTQTWTGAQVDINAISKAHCQFVLVENFHLALATDLKTSTSPQLHAVLTRLFKLFALDLIQQDIGSFTPYIHIHPQAPIVKQTIRTLLTELRPDAVALVDAWNFSDYFLNSTLGRYDGRVYEALVEAAAREPLNVGENFNVVSGYEEFYAPLIKAPLKAKL
ncbi:acyl-CoA dehydrogenase/oxidase [Powellomyces hirtus]|nr:acyl-CoA dehydrogenase/oxidase [Powellomyces hirtus]